MFTGEAPFAPNPKASERNVRNQMNIYELDRLENRNNCDDPFE